LDLVSKTRKRKGKSSSEKGNSDGGSSQPGKNKKDLSKIKCFSCHKNGHYSSQFPEKKKGNENTHTTTSVEMQLDDFATKFENDYSMISCLLTRKTMRSAWFLDSGAYHHMIEAQDLFSSMMEKESKVHLELGDDSRYAVKGEGTITIQLELGSLLDSHDVLYVPCLKKNFLSISFMEDRGFVVTF
jgi:hypothetical protein